MNLTPYLVAAEIDAKTVFDHITLALATHPKTAVIISFVIGLGLGIIL